MSEVKFNKYSNLFKDIVKIIYYSLNKIDIINELDNEKILDVKEYINKTVCIMKNVNFNKNDYIEKIKNLTSESFEEFEKNSQSINSEVVIGSRFIKNIKIFRHNCKASLINFLNNNYENDSIVQIIVEIFNIKGRRNYKNYKQNTNEEFKINTSFQKNFIYFIEKIYDLIYQLKDLNENSIQSFSDNLEKIYEMSDIFLENQKYTNALYHINSNNLILNYIEILQKLIDSGAKILINDIFIKSLIDILNNIDNEVDYQINIKNKIINNLFINLQNLNISLLMNQDSLKFFKEIFCFIYELKGDLDTKNEVINNLFINLQNLNISLLMNQDSLKFFKEIFCFIYELKGDLDAKNEVIDNLFINLQNLNISLLMNQDSLKFFKEIFCFIYKLKGDLDAKNEVIDNLLINNKDNFIKINDLIEIYKKIYESNDINTDSEEKENINNFQKFVNNFCSFLNKAESSNLTYDAMIVCKNIKNIKTFISFIEFINSDAFPIDQSMNKEKLIDKYNLYISDLQLKGLNVFQEKIFPLPKTENISRDSLFFEIKKITELNELKIY
jgi:hypothetical protein